MNDDDDDGRKKNRLFCASRRNGNVVQRQKQLRIHLLNYFWNDVIISSLAGALLFSLFVVAVVV